MRFLPLLLLLAFASCDQRKEELYLFVWSDFIAPAVIEKFEEEHNCSVVIDTFDSNESMYAKIRAGGGGYDIIFPTLYYEEIMEKQGMLESLDRSKLPNLHNLNWEWLNQVSIPRSKSSIPYMISFTGIGYRADRVASPPDSWNIFSDWRYKGRMTMLNDVREVFSAALITLGYDVNTTRKSQIEEAKKLILTWKEYLARFESEQYKNGIASSEYLIVQGYSSDLYQVGEETPEVRFVLPSEGTIISCDTMALLKKDGVKDLAYAFINYLIEPEVALMNMEKTQAVSPVVEAMYALPLNLRAKLIPSPELMMRSQIIRDVGKSVFLYHDAWDEIKSTNL